jgi:hypothetical protein
MMAVSLRGKRDNQATAAANFSDPRSFIRLSDGKLILYGKEDWAEQRTLVWNRDLGVCQRCRRSDENWQVHHIIPRGKGGSDDLENLETICWKCHTAEHVQVKWSKHAQQE